MPDDVHDRIAVDLGIEGMVDIDAGQGQRAIFGSQWLSHECIQEADCVLLASMSYQRIIVDKMTGNTNDDRQRGRARSLFARQRTCFQRPGQKDWFESRWEQKGHVSP